MARGGDEVGVEVGGGAESPRGEGVGGPNGSAGR